MGHSQNTRKSANQPKEGALDTNQDKSVEEDTATKETEENTAPGEGEEEQPVTEEEAKGAEEELTEEAVPEEAAESEKEEGAVAQVEKEVEEETAPEEAEEKEAEEEKKKKREKAEEEEIVEERIYTIPLRKAWISPRKRRAPRAMRIVKSFIQRHMKIETEPKGGEEEEEARLVISNEVNEKIWGRGIEKPPRNIRVRAVKDKEGTVTLYLAEGE